MSDARAAAYSCTVKDGVLTIAILPDFDLATLYQDWAKDLCAQHPGPFKGVRIDLTRRGPMPSIFLAGLMHLHERYRKGGVGPLVLVQPDRHVVQSLERMRIADYFTVEARQPLSNDERELIGARSFIHPSIATLAARISEVAGKSDDTVTIEALRRACVRKLRKYRIKDYLAGFAEGEARTAAMRQWELVEAFAYAKAVTPPTPPTPPPKA